MNIESQNLLSGKRIIVTILMAYTIAIIYFMFFGFGRVRADSNLQEYRFSIIPTGIPLWFPKNLSLLWFFSLGNQNNWYRIFNFDFIFYNDYFCGSF